MLTTPEIIQTQRVLAAAVHVTVPRADIAKVMGPGIGEVMAAVQAQGKGPAGPWFTHHPRMDPKVFDFEICVPVTTSIEPTGRVYATEWPATTVARTIYQGGYEGLGLAWTEFDQWMLTHGHTPTGELWEVYEVGPEAGPDASKYRTQLYRPLTAVTQSKA